MCMLLHFLDIYAFSLGENPKVRVWIRVRFRLRHFWTQTDTYTCITPTGQVIIHMVLTHIYIRSLTIHKIHNGI